MSYCSPRRQTPARGWLVTLSLMALVFGLPYRAAADDSDRQPSDLFGEANAEAPTFENPEPPDGEWLVDDQGREYFLMAIPKRIPHRVKDDGTVHVLMAGEFSIEKEDEENFYTRYYRPVGQPVPVRTEATPEELAAIVASYSFETPEVDRLVLEPADAGLPRTGQWRNGFVLADLNGDGLLDIVHAKPRKQGSRPVVFLGQEGGDWRHWEEMEFPPNSVSYGDVAVADFDQDGRPDLAVASHGVGVAVFRQVRPGRFERWSEGTEIEATSSDGQSHVFSSRRLTAVDWDQDGRIDLVALDDGPRLALGQATGGEAVTVFGPRLFLNLGSGRWEVFPEDGPDDQQLFGDDLAVGDLDGDGRPDLVVSTNRGWRRDILHLNAGGDLDAGEDPWRVKTLDEIRSHSYVRALTLGDFDGDGRMDLAFAYQSYEQGWRVGLDLFLNGAEGWVRKGVFARDGRDALTALDSGDVDGNGKLDLVAIDDIGNGLLFLGVGDGTFERDLSPELDRPRGRCRGYQVRLEDLNGDGRDDVVANYAGEPSPLFDPLKCTSQGGLMAWISARSSAVTVDP